MDVSRGFASSHDAASYAAAPPALNRSFEEQVEFLEARKEPNFFAAIRLAHEGAQSGTFSQVPRDIADDRDALPILHEFLDQFAGDARFQLEEFIGEALYRNHDQRSAILKRLADELDGVAIGLQLRSISHAFEDAHAMKFVEFRRQHFFTLSPHHLIA
jgi:hypothetical protein